MPAEIQPHISWQESDVVTTVSLCTVNTGKKKNQVIKEFWQKATLPSFHFSRTLTPSHTLFLWPTRVRPPNGISIGSAALAGLNNVNNKHRQTDWSRYSVCSNRPLSLADAAMRPNNTIIAVAWGRHQWCWKEEEGDQQQPASTHRAVFARPLNLPRVLKMSQKESTLVSVLSTWLGERIFTDHSVVWVVQLVCWVCVSTFRR